MVQDLLIKKNKHWITALLVVSLLAPNFLFSIPVAHAQVPQFINYQSRLRDSSGTAITATTTIRFAIYNDSSSGVPTSTPSSSGPLLWSELYDQDSGDCAYIDPDTDGYFSAQLGTCTSFPSYLDFDTDTLYVGATVESDIEASPRAQLGTAPYAFTAGQVTGTEQSSIGTTTPVENAVLTIEATSTSAVAAVIKGFAGQIADLFRIVTAAGTQLLTLTANGLFGIGTSTPSALLSVTNTGSGHTVYIEDEASDASPFVIDASGRVGIGTTTPDDIFVIQGDGVENPFEVYSSTGEPQFIINANGNVGMGTTSPYSKLSLGADVSTKLAVYEQAEAGNYFYGIGMAQGGDYGLGLWGGTEGSAPSDSNTHMFIARNTGNVGIGTESPSGLLHVYSGDARFEPTVGEYLDIEANTNEIEISTEVTSHLRLHSGGYMTADIHDSTAYFDVVVAGGNPLFRVNGDGNVGIGTTTLARALTVVGTGAAIRVDTSASANSGLEIYQNGSYKWAMYNQSGGNDLRFYDGTVDRLTLQNGGNVGIGTTSPYAKLSVSGDSYFTATSTFAGVLVLNEDFIQTTAQPQITSTLSGFNGASGVFVQGRYLYVANNEEGNFEIIDISKPDSPVQIGASGSGINGAREVFVEGDYAYVTSSSGDLDIFDISDKTAPSRVGGADVNNGWGIHVSEGYAYVADNNGKFFSVDVRDPTNPSIVDSISIVFNDSQGLYKQGDYVYVTVNAGNKLIIVDVSDPTNVFIIGTLTGTVTPADVHVSGHYAFVISETENLLRSIDVSDVTNPTNVSTVSVSTTPYGVYVSGKYAYVTSVGGDSLDIVDISDPSSMQVVETLTDSTNLNGARGIYVSGQYAYVGSLTSDNIAVIDLGGIESPAASIGNLSAGSLDVWDDAAIAQSLYVGSSLNVGAGISAHMLVITTSTTSPSVTINQTGTGDILNLEDNGTEVFTVLDGGNVGIGTTSPSSKFSVSGNSYLAGTLAVTSTATFSGDILNGTKNLTDYADFYNGSFLETFNATTTSDGSTVTVHLGNKANSGDLTMRFSAGDVTLTAPTSTALTAGSDISPTENYVYIPVDTQVLTVSTNHWPHEQEHIKVAYFLVPSASFVQSNGTYINQNWNDAATDDVGQGHMTHLAERSRYLGAAYHSGMDGNGDGATYVVRTDAAPDTVYVKTVSGVVYQMHEHDVPAYDTSGSDAFLIPNSSVNVYESGSDLYNFLVDSDGDSMSDKYYNLILWAVANKGGEYAPLMVNLPSCSYNTQSAAEQDTSGCDIFTIPAEFARQSGTGFLIARLTMKHTITGSDLELISTTDLRGLSPQSASGGTAGGSLLDFADNQFTVYDETDSTKVLVFDVGTNLTTGNTRTLTLQDSSGTIGLLEATQTWSGVNTFSNTSIFTGNVGIGTSTSYSVLSVWGGSSGSIFEVVTNASSTALFIDSSGNVGIGTTSPYAKLSVVGETIAEYFTATSTSATSTLPNFSLTNLLFGGDYLTDLVGVGLTNTANVLTVATSTFNLDPSSIDLTQGYTLVGDSSGNASATSALFIVSAGNVGIGTISPGYLLDLGTSFGSGDAARKLAMYNTGDDFYGFGVSVGTLEISAGKALGDSPDMVILSSGNVGIGTTSPYAKLSVVGEIVASYFTATSTSATSTFAGGLAVETSGLVYDYSSNNVGIGTTTPGNTLTINGDTEIADGNGLIIGNSSQITTHSTTELQVLGTSGADSSMTLGRFANDIYQPQIEFVKSRSTTIGGNAIVQDGDAIGGLHWHPDDGVDYATSIARFHVQVDDASPAEDDIGAEFVWSLMPGGGGAISNVMILRASGNLGIGNSSPSYKLDVTGDGHFTSFVDAEYFTATSTTATSTFAGGLAIETSGLVYDYSTNNVGIGTASPTKKLYVDGDSNSGILLKQGAQIDSSSFSSTFYNGLTFENYNTSHAYSMGYDTGGDFSINHFDGSSTYTNMLYIDQGGNVGIGTTTPSANLVINGTTGQNLFQIATSTNQNILVVDANGYFGIGTSSPFTTLSVDGNGYFDGTLTASGNMIASNYFIGSKSIVDPESPTPYGVDNTDLVGYWTGNGNAKDYSGYGNDGTLTGGATSTDAVFGKGFEFDGTDDHVDIGDVDAYEFSSSFTLSVWVKIQDIAGVDTVVSKGGGGPAGWMLAFDSAEQPYIQTNSLSAQGSAISQDEWHHLVAGYDGTDLFLYVDGSLADTQTTALAQHSTKIFSIGSQNGDNQFLNGSVDEVMLFERELSFMEIQALYSAGIKFKTSGSYVYYEGNVGIGTTTPSRTLTLSGDMQIDDASGSSDPFIEFTSQGSAGGYVFYDTSEDTMVMRHNTGANSQLVLDNAGNVGIGTIDPKSNLHILTSGTSELGSVVLDRGVAITGIGGRSRIYFEATDSTSGERVFAINDEGGLLSFGSLDDTATAFTNENILVLDHDTGNVGIGTAAPYSKLSLGIDVTNKLAVYEETNSTFFYGIGMSLGTDYGLGLWGGTEGSVSSDSNTHMFIARGSGNVGIGTTSPSNKLHVYTTSNADGISVDGSSNPALIMRSDNTPRGYLASVTGATNYFSDSELNDLILRGETGLKLGVGTGGAAGMTFDNDGNVGIGTSTPNQTLHVLASGASGYIGMDRGILITDSVGPRLLFEDSGETTNDKIMMMRYEGQSLIFGSMTDIGTEWDSANILALNRDGNIRFGNYGAGTLITDSSGNITASSDERLKNITGSFDKGLTAIAGLNPVNYQWTEESGFDTVSTYSGFIAQNVQEFIPEAVGQGPDGYLTLSDRPIIAATVNAIKELNLNLESIASATATSTPESESFAAEFFSNLFAKVTQWLADATNGIGSVFANVFNAKEKICVDGECLTKDDIRDILDLVNGQTVPLDPARDDSAESPAESDTEAPVITINGNNPAEIAVGTSYSDLGVVVIDNVNDNLGHTIQVDGIEVTNIQLDTSTSTTYIITYTATDEAGNVGTAERTVIVYSELVEPAEEVIDVAPPAPEETTATTTPEVIATSTPEVIIVEEEPEPEPVVIEETPTDTATSTATTTDPAND
jgi:hypothetical protein